MGRTYRKIQDKFEKARKRLNSKILDRIQKAFEDYNEDFEEVPTNGDHHDNRSTNNFRANSEV